MDFTIGLCANSNSTPSAMEGFLVARTVFLGYNYKTYPPQVIFTNTNIYIMPTIDSIFSLVIQYKPFLIFFVTLALAYFLIKVLRKKALEILIKFNSTRKLFVINLLIDKIRDIKWYLILTMSYLFASTISRPLPEEIADTVNKVAIIIIAVFIIGIVVEIANWFVSLTLKKDNQADPLENGGQVQEEDVMITQMIGWVARILIWSLSMLTLLESLGFKTGTIMGTLGIGGIAVAFAMQSVLKDIFASASIYFDKPFKIGDIIQVEKDIGHVSAVSFQSTRIRALEGDEIVLPNTVLIGAKIRNYKKMLERRISFTSVLSLNNESEEVKDISIFRQYDEIVAAAITSLDDTRFERCFLIGVNGNRYKYETVYYVTSNDFNKFREVHEKIILKLGEELPKRNLKLISLE
jgi:small-conductance mechanosensitive channel